MDELRANSTAYPRLYRLVSTNRLRRLGMTFDQIAAELGISSRQARRLAKRSVFVALRRHLVRVDAAPGPAADLFGRRPTTR